MIRQCGGDATLLPLLVEKCSIPPVRSGPVTACPSPCAGTCPAGDGSGQAPPGLSGSTACVGPPHPRVTPGRPPAPPSAPLSPGAGLRAPGLLGRSLRLDRWVAGRRAVSGKPFVPQNGVLRPKRFPGSLSPGVRAGGRAGRGSSEPLSAFPVRRACPRWGPAAPSAGASHPVLRPGPAHFGTLADPRGRPAPLRGSLAGSFPDRAWKALIGWAAVYVLLWSAYTLPWMFS